jgi:DNA invertase Pin-like site-specific DNA recombinase
MAVHAYLRLSTARQDMDNQRHGAAVASGLGEAVYNGRTRRPG